jgi:hypothetical protein
LPLGSLPHQMRTYYPPVARGRKGLTTLLELLFHHVSSQRVHARALHMLHPRVCILPYG